MSLMWQRIRRCNNHNAKVSNHTQYYSPLFLTASNCHMPLLKTVVGMIIATQFKIKVQVKLIYANNSPQFA